MSVLDLKEKCDAATECLFRNIPPEQARQVIREIAAEGARDVLSQLGLGGPTAAADMASVRSFFSGYHTASAFAKNSFIKIIKQGWQTLSSIVLAIVIYHWMTKMGFDPKAVASAIKGGE